MAEPHAGLRQGRGVDEPGEPGIEEGGKGTVVTQHHHAQRRMSGRIRPPSRAPRLLVSNPRTVAEAV
ncbi:hypothetical protein JCM2811A_08890 [Methylorubrum rhodinum]